MTIHWKDTDFQFIWYVRKYKHIIQRSKDYVANQIAINDIYNDTLNYNMKIFSIPINIRISSNDTWEAIKCKIMKVINQENLYNYIYRKLKSIYSVSSSLVPMLQQFDQIKDNYYA